MSKLLWALVIAVPLVGILLLAASVVEMPRQFGNQLLAGLEPVFGPMDRMDWGGLLRWVIRAVGAMLPAVGLVVTAGKPINRTVFEIFHGLDEMPVTHKFVIVSGDGGCSGEWFTGRSEEDVLFKARAYAREIGGYIKSL